MGVPPPSAGKDTLVCSCFLFTNFSKHIKPIISQNILAIKKGDPFVKSFIKSEMGKVRCSVSVNILCRYLNDDGIKRVCVDSGTVKGDSETVPSANNFNSILLKRGLLC